MTKLHQLIATEKTRRGVLDNTVTKTYQEATKTALFDGLVKTYASLDDEGLIYPGEAQKVLNSAPKMLAKIAAAEAELFDFVVTKDAANTRAKADIVVDGVVLAADVPVTTLLWMEKQLVHLATVIGHFPVTNPAEDWTWSTDDELWHNVPAKTLRQKKVTKYITVAPATDKHAAQVVSTTEDVAEGWWSTQKLSGALAPARKAELLARVNKLATAVKTARETANQTEVADVKIGKDVLDFVFG